MLSMDNRRKKGRLFRILRNGVIILLILVVVVILFIRSPWGQDIIVRKAVSYLSEKTSTHIDIDRLYITFGGDISLSGLYIEDLSGDTLLYSRSLEVDIPFIPILRGKGIGVESVVWNGLRAHVARQDTITGFNYQFLIDAFVTESTSNPITDTAVAEPRPILLGKLDFSELDLSYDDEVVGINSRVKIGGFQVDVETFDMQHMVFGVHHARLVDVDLAI